MFVITNYDVGSTVSWKKHSRTHDVAQYEREKEIENESDVYVQNKKHGENLERTCNQHQNITFNV